jgi:hypothetical protein
MKYAVHKFSVGQTNPKRFAFAAGSLRHPVGGSSTSGRRGRQEPVIVNVIDNVVNWLAVLCSFQFMSWDNSNNW